MRVSSSINLHCHSRENFAEFIKAGLEFHKENGFDAADFSCGLLDLSSDKWKSQVEKILKIQNEVGIKFEVCHLPFFASGLKCEPERLAKHCKNIDVAIDAAAALGIEYAVLHPGAKMTPIELYDKREQHDLVLKHIAPFAEHASKVGLNLALENMRIAHDGPPGMRYGHSPDEICDIADKLGIGVCWDFGHAHLSGIKQSEGLSFIGKRLKVLHLNDNFGVDDNHLPPFMGAIDWQDAMNGLALTDFKGLFNFEVGAAKVPKAARTSYAKFLVDSAHALISLMEKAKTE